MTVHDVDDFIKGFNEEWMKALEDATAENIPAETAPLDPLDKGKYKVGFKRKDAVEVPPAAQKKKKFKISTPTIETALIEDEYDLIAVRVQEKMRDSF